MTAYRLTSRLLALAAALAPVLATAALRHVYNRVTRLKTDGRLEEGMKPDAGTAVRLLKEVMGLVDSGT